MIHVPSEINHPKPGGVLLVGRDPGSREVEEGRPFVGPAGQELDAVLALTGLRRQDVNITNVVDVQPYGNDFKRHDPKDVYHGIARLKALVYQLQPSLIITMGNEASYALIEDWPSRGNSIFGAKGIMDRRGYFWRTEYGTILSTLHPAGVIREPVPGQWLLRRDFMRARRVLEGKLTYMPFPTIERLHSQAQVDKLLTSRLVAWDIENKWNSTALFCSGYCGDDLQPMVASYPFDFQQFGYQPLLSHVPKVGHNGLHDTTSVAVTEGIEVVAYDHDTMQMWHALQPELAGSDETGGEEAPGTTSRRVTRKGLAFLMSLWFWVDWWKNYPEPDDPQYFEKTITLNGRDAWATRLLAEVMLKEMEKEQVTEQYHVAMRMYPSLKQTLIQGLAIDETLRLERIDQLTTRATVGMERSTEAALAYIKEHDIKSFTNMKQCQCCGGGKVVARGCWQCSGLDAKPKKKADYQAWYEAQADDPPFKQMKMADLKQLLIPCQQCGGTGKIKEYFFNPTSGHQMKRLLYDYVGTPKHTWKGKDKMDEVALQKLYKWATGR